MENENQAEKTDIQIDNENSAEDQQQEGVQDQEEFEISLGSPTDSRNNNPMVTRIIGQRDQAREKLSASEQKIRELEDKINNISSTTNVASPKWEDFNTDEDYQNAVVEYVSKKMQNNQPKNNIDPIKQFNIQQKVSQGIESHYKKASELAKKFPGYSQAEQTAHQSLGDALSSEIATRANNSAELMLFFGTNPSEALRFKLLAEQDPVSAGIELGRLDEKVKVQSKNKQSNPEPDEPLSGGSGNSASSSAWQKQLDKARSSGDVNAAINIKRQAASGGVYLE